MNRVLNLLTASRIGTRLIIATTILTIVAAMVFVSGFAQEDKRQEIDLTEDAAAARRKAETPTEKKEISTVQDESGLAPEAILAVANTANYTFTTNSTSSLKRTAGSGVDNIDMSTGVGQLLANSVDDTASAITPIGFDFFLMGVRYNQFSVNDNGNMRVGTTTVQAASPYSMPNGAVPLLNPFGNDMRVGTDGVIVSKVIGTAPNRVLVVQWTNVMIRFATAAPGGGTFQARIYETTGAIEYVYGSMVTNAAAPTTYTVGFSVNITINNILSVNTTTNTSSTSATVTTNSYSASSTVTQLHSTTDGSRRAYMFAPPTPTAPTSLTFTGVTTTGMTLNWVDSPDDVAYAIYRSTDGVNFSYAGAAASDATSFAATGLANNQSYTWQVYAVSEGRLSSALSGTQATTAGTICGTFTVGPTFIIIGIAFLH
ncbi:MAG: fibronectin type III domain-containing protein [Pyrinomonadaceae bacterium]|nr:fibronectin type III domain-containing protein [Pyrinomonadaceae bacterium]